MNNEVERLKVENREIKQSRSAAISREREAKKGWSDATRQFIADRKELEAEVERLTAENKRLRTVYRIAEALQDKDHEP